MGQKARIVRPIGAADRLHRRGLDGSDLEPGLPALIKLVPHQIAEVARVVHAPGQPFSAPAVSPSTRSRSVRKKTAITGTVRITAPAMTTVVGTSIVLLAS